MRSVVESLLGDAPAELRTWPLWMSGEAAMPIDASDSDRSVPDLDDTPDRWFQCR
jgi:hypothetical protein